MINGLFAKVLGMIPRHQAIVARFFGTKWAPVLTRLIGVMEIGMAVWVLSGFERRWCAITQIIVVLMMNGLELWRARDLLLFPRLMPVANVFLVFLALWWGAF